MSIDEILNAAEIIEQDGQRVVQLDYEVWQEVVDLLGQVDEARWEALFADKRSETVLTQLINDTLTDIEAGRVTPIEISRDDNLVAG